VTREHFVHALLLAGMLAVGALGWWLQLRPELAHDATALRALPDRAGAWIAEDIPLRDTVEQMLSADLSLQRIYANEKTGALAWLYVGYYGTPRGGRPEHTPWQCYPSAGWRIDESGLVVVDPGRGVFANELIVSMDGESRLVHFWYQSSRQTGLLGAFDVSLDQLRGRLGDGRADGGLVRLSTPIEEGDVRGARRRLRNLARRLIPMLVERWPSETPIS